MKTSFILCISIAALLTACEDRKAATELEKIKRENANLAERVAAQEAAAALEKRAAVERELASQADANRAEAERLAAERAGIEAARARMAANAELDATKRSAAELELKKREEAARIAEENAAAARAKAEAAAKKAALAARMEDERRAADERNLHPLQTVAGRTTEFFYDALDPYGDWDEVEGYGHVFQPREATRDPNWRPYTDGEWTWTDQGWTWRSNEPHGWATSHYGRWFKHAREGWMWVPGSEWAPAWVAWRKNDSYVGWAPLPPEAHSGRGFNATVDDYYDIGARHYVFVPRDQFSGGKTYIGKVIAPERNTTIIQTTVNVTNITYRSTNNTTVIVNNGPDINFINSRAAAPLQTLRLERLDAPQNVRSAAPAMIAGGILRMIAPVIAHEKPATAPKQVRRIATRQVDRGWDGTDRETEQLIKKKAANEARRAEEDERTEFINRFSKEKPNIAVPPTKQTPELKSLTPPQQPGGLRPAQPIAKPIAREATNQPLESKPVERPATPRNMAKTEAPKTPEKNADTTKTTQPAIQEKPVPAPTEPNPESKKPMKNDAPVLPQKIEPKQPTPAPTTKDNPVGKPSEEVTPAVKKNTEPTSLKMPLVSDKMAPEPAKPRVPQKPIVAKPDVKKTNSPTDAATDTTSEKEESSTQKKSESVAPKAPAKGAVKNSPAKPTE